MRTLDRKRVTTMLESIFIEEDLHAKRLESLTNYAIAAMEAPRAAVHAIGAAYAEVAEIKPRHGVKQVDRFLSNQGIDVEALTPAWARFVIGSRKEIIVALDWTDFDLDDHSVLCAYVVTTHGRATPLCWKTHTKSKLTDGARTEAEHTLIERLSRAVPEDVSITLLADRGFGDQVLYQVLDLLGWRYVIRFRGIIAVEHEGATKPAAKWLPPSGRATKLRAARVTNKKTEVGAIVVVKAAGMKDIWCLATNLGEQTAAAIVKLYGRRFTIEETFRDVKDLRFGMGLRETRIRSAARRDRLLMLLALAQALLTLLGAACERSGLDAYLKVNTVKHRTHSLFRQGSYWYGRIATMREAWLIPLMKAFAEVLAEQAEMTAILGVV
jgi:DDE family transposase